jgi:hypothetical protein
MYFSLSRIYSIYVGITTGISCFAECLKHSAKHVKHLANDNCSANS